ncbi:hypothetical protein [Streptomyces sp. NPDC057363]|uniref:hypothetical protein n=1 Tax=Streptomyces sp. NPDC057363 TaxID=3346107 RepID=UPI00362ADAD2
MPPEDRDDVPPILEQEVFEAREALAVVLGEAEIKLPQLWAQPVEKTWRVELGACNARVARALVDLCRDGMTLRKRHPEEAVPRGK